MKKAVCNVSAIAIIIFMVYLGFTGFIGILFPFTGDLETDEHLVESGVFRLIITIILIIILSVFEYVLYLLAKKLFAIGKTVTGSQELPVENKKTAKKEDGPIVNAICKFLDYIS